MNSEKLSTRLAAVASFVEQGATLADIGSDHAYLPCCLVKAGTISKAIAGEVVKGPYESAVRNVRKKGLSDEITVRLANGLEAVHPSDGVDTISIAGMGGPLIATILNDGIEKLENVKRIITQPNIHALSIREWAVQNGWQIIDEQILKEDHKIYEIIVLEKGQAEYNELEMMVGPYLLDRKSDIFIEKWKREVDEWKRVLDSLENAGNTEAIDDKKEQLRNKIELVGGILSN
ncbi:tRNA (adenine(22)-N(1))-methyltransferase TrmK [Sporosarcina sp. ACRSL]|uniref:tRNA (adenine(22)-N(1))-methyltransferase n=1 Tax=Sporosarcina sp. ACRSL TaxID=2918215 RepID=UPI001EF526A4|nr:tRNA (adenine(22)-N(1))-methyltransferase TrmK [Sporosarcina sp. ACRSL]MCG7345113.1 tRNA (adenine(22)-N(1))-methyltransferase TrmK [Sporosarcina sp. ACRSL]